MQLPINLDLAGNTEQPTFVLEYRSGHRIGSLHDVNDLCFENSLGNASIFTFSVDKINTPYYYAIKNFRLVWIPEWDKYYEINVDINENQKKTKNVILTHLPEAELSQIMLHNIEINTEDDIARDNYVSTTIYNADDTKGSLLHRITGKAVNFIIKHVDASLANLWRTFSFDNISLYDAFQEIAEELNCIFLFDSYTDEDGNIVRAISAYDLECWCPQCGHRDENMVKCPECGNEEIVSGYGEDTTIFLSLDNVAEEIGYKTDVGSVKNCFRLEAGDDGMTAAVMSINPSGSQYIYAISDEMKEDMSEDLVNRIDSYNTVYDEYYYTMAYADNLDLAAINELIEKYPDAEIGNVVVDQDGISHLTGYTEIIGYAALTNLLYDVLDMQSYLEHELMPSVDLQLDDTTAIEQAHILENYNWSATGNGVAIQNLKSKLASNPNYFSTSSAELAVETAIKKKADTLVDSRYTVDVITTSITANGAAAGIWKGTFTVENDGAPDDDFYPGENDTAKEVTIPISGNYEDFIKQCIDITLAKAENEDYDITGLFKKNYPDFVSELDKYGIVSLQSLQNACQSIIDILIEQGVAEEGMLFDNKDLYNEIYVPYTQKYEAIETALNTRQSEYDNLVTLEEQISKIENEVHDILDFESYVKRDANGELTDEKLWREFCSFRREDTYSNSNYSSEGLSNAELLDRAKEFVSAAQKEILKSATLQHSIQSTVKNLIAIKEFEPLLEHFDVGNWLRVEVDNNIHRLRLLSYTITFDDDTNIDVEFSDVIKIGGYLSDLQSVMHNVTTMSSSYSSVQRQAERGNEANKHIVGWTEEGLSATAVKIMNHAGKQTVIYDEHGLWFKTIDEITGEYDPRQSRFINSTMAITNDNWKTTKTAIGRFYYYDPVSGELIEAYGINAETVIGKLILGEQLGIYNDSNSLTFDANGLTISNGTNTFVVNPNAASLVTIYKENTSNPIFSINDDGDLSITGTITATRGKIGCWYITQTEVNNGVWGSGFGTGFGQKTGSSFSETDMAFWAGDAKFRVNYDGSVLITDSKSNDSAKLKIQDPAYGYYTKLCSWKLGCYGGGSNSYRSELEPARLEISGAENMIRLDADTGIVDFETGEFLIDAYNVSIAGDVYIDNGISTNNKSSMWINVLKGHAGLNVSEAGASSGANGLARVKCTNGAWAIATLNQDNSFRIAYGNESRLNSEENGCDALFSFYPNGTSSISGFTFGGNVIRNETGCIISNGNSCGLYGTENRFRTNIDNDGNMELGVANARWKKIYAASSSISTSDERDKNIIGYLDKRHKELFMKLKPIVFQWRDREIDTCVHFGLGAQTTERAARECGILDREMGAIQHDFWDEPSLKDGRTDRYGMAYEEIGMLTIPVVQEHEERMQECERRMEALEKENRELKEAIKTLMGVA